MALPPPRAVQHDQILLSPHRHPTDLTPPHWQTITAPHVLWSTWPVRQTRTCLLLKALHRHAQGDKKSQQDRPLPPYEALRPERLSEGQGLPVKTQLALLYKNQKLFQQSNSSFQNTTALQVATGPSDLAVPRACILPRPWSQGMGCCFRSLCSLLWCSPNTSLLEGCFIFGRLAGRRNFFSMNNHILYHKQCRNNPALFQLKIKVG